MKHILIVHTAVDPAPYTLSLSAGYRFALLKKCPTKRDYDCFDRVLDVCYEDDIGEALAQVRSLHERDPLNGVLSFSESGVLMASFIARDLQLPGSAPPAVLRARNKYLMRRAIQTAGLPSPRFHLVRSAQQIQKVIRRHGNPMVLKPISGSSSYGVIRLTPKDSLSEINAHLTEVRRYIQTYRQQNTQYPFEFWLPGSGYGINISDVMDPEIEFLLEDFIDGVQVSVDGIVSRDSVSCFGVIEVERVKHDDYFIEYEEWMPTHLGADREMEIQDIVMKTIRAIGLNNSCFHCELKLNESGIFPIEIAARRGADNVTDFLKRVTGVNIYEEAMRIAAGEYRVYDSVLYKGCMKMRYFLPETPGTLIRINGAKTVRQDSRVSELHLEYAPGDRVLTPPDSYEFLGYLSVFDRTPDAAAAALESLYAQISFDIDSTTKSELVTAS